ncbi:MAG: alpha-amylase family glycosyl hydrolase [Candidatus Eisenbacteria bacterium]
MEFHVSRAARDRYGIDAAWFALTGNVVLADLAATRRLARLMNRDRDVAGHPERAVQTGSLHAMGLIDEILHYVAGLYRDRVTRTAMTRAREVVEERIGRPALDALLLRFTERFPPQVVYRGDTGAAEWLEGASGGVSHRELALEELLLLWLANVNPAFEPYSELFGDQVLDGTRYAEAIAALESAFTAMPVFGPDAQPLVAMLRSPAIASPHSLAGQLEYIRSRWADLLGEFLQRLLTSLDAIREEERARAWRVARWTDTPRVPVPSYTGVEAEPERFTPDRDWMPHVVMIAKSVQVWLDQLSRTHRREVRRLDQIPDEELDRLAAWGINGLWMIGLWERSRASERIKHLTGNPEAGASAYSLDDYRIAEALGGEAALAELSGRATRRGIRLASDMVPNHMGIDSVWVREHPERFLQTDDPPYPGYTFDGPDLSDDGRVGIFLEDHYYDRSDAAVVFKRVDRAGGGTRYLYHGNDGTHTPWNDTAQLDYLRADTREAVITTILDVARRFPIIRFDAAMTLAKRHYHRLWFPEPGSGGGIPSRAEHGLTRQAFDAAMPVEFWREVVDRVGAAMPDTLLLAEAFWLMEGFFVRTLGMHRVYNSAFMNMLRDELNADYRSVIKNTLEFDPEILKRYVNFMNNPDERTAVDQFGSGDKYFGVCVVMATLPGLPMFGHGQIEGFTERYGMEFRRASRVEEPDRELVARHEREVFPLLHRRRWFAEAREFRLYDFFTDTGAVNEDVFAYSNRHGAERSLVLYHNRYADTAGWVRWSCAVAVKGEDGLTRTLRRDTIGDALGLPDDPACWVRFRDHLTGLEYLRHAPEIRERGMWARLDAYRCHVFVEFQVVRDGPGHPWGRLAHALGGRGTRDLDHELHELALEPVLTPWRALLDPEVVRGLAARGAATASRRRPRRAVAAPVAAARTPDAAAVHTRAIVELASRYETLARVVREWTGLPVDPTGAVESFRTRLAAIADGKSVAPGGLRPATTAVVVTRAILETLAGGDVAGPAGRARGWLRDWRWGAAVIDLARGLGAGEDAAWRAPSLLEVTLAHTPGLRRELSRKGGLARALATWGDDPEVHRALRVHEHDGTRWFHRESWEDMVNALCAAAALDAATEPGIAPTTRARRVQACRRASSWLVAAAARAGYRWDDLLETEPAPAGGTRR